MNRFLVVSRGPGGRSHLDVVLAKNASLAEDRVKTARTRGNAGEKGRGSYPVAYGAKEVAEMASKFFSKCDEEVEKVFSKIGKSAK